MAAVLLETMRRHRSWAMANESYSIPSQEEPEHDGVPEEDDARGRWLLDRFVRSLL